MTPAEEAASILKDLGVDATSGELISQSPIDGSEIGRVQIGGAGNAATAALESYHKWRTVPAPRRGELVIEHGHLPEQRLSLELEQRQQRRPFIADDAGRLAIGHRPRRLHLHRCAPGSRHGCTGA